MKRTPLKRFSRLRPMSERRQKASRVYAASRRAFLTARPFCEACRVVAVEVKAVNRTAHRSGDVHHVCGRLGPNLLDERTWLAVCRRCHDWIHQHPLQARALGLLK